MSEIKFYAPSYKRANGVTTQKYLPYVKYVVAESEAEEYKKEGHDIWVVPDTAQGNLCRIRNYILDHGDSDQIIIFDDDMGHIGRWNEQKQKKLTANEVLEFVEHGFNLTTELDVKYWGINLLPDKGAYLEYTPFSMVSYIGGPFQAFNNLELRYDEKLPLKEDYDLSLQVLNKYRKVLRFNMYYYSVKQHTNTGGCATYRTKQREIDQFEALQKKWGSKIVQKDPNAEGFDINPIIKIPINGI